MENRPRYRVPDELRETLLDFTIAYLLERPANLANFGLGFFQRLRDEREGHGTARVNAAPGPGTVNGGAGTGAPPPDELEGKGRGGMRQVNQIYPGAGPVVQIQGHPQQQKQVPQPQGQGGHPAQGAQIQAQPQQQDLPISAPQAQQGHNHQVPGAQAQVHPVPGIHVPGQGQGLQKTQGGNQAPVVNPAVQQLARDIVHRSLTDATAHIKEAEK